MAHVGSRIITYLSCALDGEKVELYGKFVERLRGKRIPGKAVTFGGALGTYFDDAVALGSDLSEVIKKKKINEKKSLLTIINELGESRIGEII